MSPREFLARKTEQRDLTLQKPSVSLDSVSKIAAIHAELVVDHFVQPSTRTDKRRDVSKPLRWFMLTDALALVLAYVCAWGLAATINGMFYNRQVPDLLNGDDMVRLLHMAVAVGTILWFENKGHYRLRMPFWVEVQNVINSCACVVMIDGFIQFAAKQDFSRLWLMSSWGFAALFILLGRVAARSYMRGNDHWQVRTLLVGKGEISAQAEAAINSEAGLGYEVVGRVDNLPKALALAGQSWERLCAQFGADYIVIALDGADLAEAETAMAQLQREKIPFSVSPPLRQLPVFGMVPQYFFNHNVMLLTHSCKLEQPMPQFIKRCFDILVASAVLIMLSPVLGLVALLVKMDGGPILFGHKRIGRDGKPFFCLKFRSMVTDSAAALQKYLEQNPAAKEEWQRDHKLRNDPRVTKIGNFLRRSSIDEFPQFLNVMKGEMSLVGPRPIIMAETDKYDSDISHYYRVRPGITGLWQVSCRNDVSYQGGIINR